MVSAPTSSPTGFVNGYVVRSPDHIQRGIESLFIISVHIVKLSVHREKHSTSSQWRERGERGEWGGERGEGRRERREGRRERREGRRERRSERVIPVSVGSVLHYLLPALLLSLTALSLTR